MTKADFSKWKFAGSLPAVIVLNIDPPQLPMGAIATEFDIKTSIPDNRVILQQIWYSTQKRVHGLLHYDGPNPNQLVFFGYECQNCHQVFLVPDWVEDETGLAVSLRHDGCSGSGLRCPGGPK
jgi:hypothetical protein